MRLNFEAAGKPESFEMNGDDLAELVAQATDYFAQHHPDIHSADDFAVRLVDALLNSLARDLADINLQLH